MDLNLYDPFRDMTFSESACFLCGTAVSKEDRIPVFPKWLQARYDLGDKKLLLLDQSTVSYAELQIPCCPACKQKIDSLEEEMSLKSKGGLQGLKELDEKTLFLCLAKIVYGILVTELKTELNPLIKPEHSVGENPNMLRKFQSFFMLLQAIRLPIVFDDFMPCSVFIVPIQTNGEPEFNYRDDMNTMMFSLQLDDVLILCSLLDNGFLSKALSPLYNEISGRVLQPIQAAEFSARVYYAAYLFNLIPEFFPRKTKPGDTEIIYDSLVDDITMSIFNPWENSVYATALEKFWLPWQVSRAEILQNPDSPLSFLLDENGEFRTLI